jgi:hypothetical protein
MVNFLIVFKQTVLSKICGFFKNPLKKKKGIKEMSQTDNYIFDLSDKVTRKSVSYKNRFGIKIAADLYLPKDFDESKKHAAIIVANSTLHHEGITRTQLHNLP